MNERRQDLGGGRTKEEVHRPTWCLVVRWPGVGGHKILAVAILPHLSVHTSSEDSLSSGYTMSTFDDTKWWKVSLDEQMKEYPKIRREDVAALQEWIDKQPHLPKLSDNLLGVFLAACNYSMEGVKRAVEINYTLRTRYPRIFSNRDINSKGMEIARKYLQMGVLPHKKGRPVVMVYAFRSMDASLFDLEVMLRACYMLQDITNLQLGPVPEGYVFVCDMKHWTLGHILRSPLPICAAFLKYAQEGSNCKIFQLHYMNTGPALEKFLSMIKPFISAELWKVMFLHENTNGLQKYLEPEEIPKDFEGGQAASVDQLTDEGMSLVEGHLEWFKGEEVLRVSEDKRPAGSTSLIDEGSLQGSFRKLDID